MSRTGIVSLCIAFSALLVAFVPSAQAQDEIQLVDATKSEWQAKLDAYGNTHRIVNWNIRVVGNEPRYTLTMVRGPVPSFQMRTHRTSSAFAELQREYASRGYQFKKQVTYKIGNETYYAGFWEK